MLRLLLAVVIPANSVFLPAQANSVKPAYDISLPRAEKIKLAKSAAPPEVSDKATIYVLDANGYVKIQDGTNGFSCFVDRQTPLNMEPTCFDAEGSATTLLTRLYAEEQRAKGKNEDRIKNEIDDGYKTGKFLAPRKPGNRLYAFRFNLPVCSLKQPASACSAAPEVLRALCHRAGPGLASSGPQYAEADSPRTAGCGDDRVPSAKGKRHSLSGVVSDFWRQTEDEPTLCWVRRVSGQSLPRSSDEVLRARCPQCWRSL